MKSLIVALALLTGAGTVVAGSMEIIRQRAKDMRNQNNAQQGVPGYGQPVARPVTPVPAAPSLENMAGVRADLAAIKKGTELTAEQKQKLGQHLAAAVQGGTKPSAASLDKLAADLSAAFVESPLPSASQGRLVQELDAVLNPAKYPQAKLEGILADIQNTFQGNGLAQRQAVLLVEQLKTVAAEARGQAASAK